MNYRIDGYEEVTGAKFYARDVRARDMARMAGGDAACADPDDAGDQACLQGRRLNSLGKDLQPDVTVRPEDLKTDLRGFAQGGALRPLNYAEVSEILTR